MQEYHKQWLTKHKHISEQFLSECLSNGFDIHHIDGDHDNNNPENLVLIYSGDHVALHGMPEMRRHKEGKWITQEEFDNIRMSNGESAYNQRLNGKRWEEIDVKSAINAAKFYAIKKGLAWPIVPLVPVQRKPKKRKALFAYNMPIMYKPLLKR